MPCRHMSLLVHFRKARRGSAKRGFWAVEALTSELANVREATARAVLATRFDTIDKTQRLEVLSCRAMEKRLHISLRIFPKCEGPTCAFHSLIFQILSTRKCRSRAG